MSPEQAAGREATRASDVFSLAATLLYAVEDTGPFLRDTTVATLAAEATQPPQAPVRAGALGPVLLAMMAKVRGPADDFEQLQADTLSVVEQSFAPG